MFTDDSLIDNVSDMQLCPDSDSEPCELGSAPPSLVRSEPSSLGSQQSCHSPSVISTAPSMSPIAESNEETFQMLPPSTEVRLGTAPRRHSYLDNASISATSATGSFVNSVNDSIEADTNSPPVLNFKVNPELVERLPEQRRKVVARKGVSFTLMLAGESGSGKTTLVNTLFNECLASAAVNTRPKYSSAPATSRIEIHRAGFVEKGFSGTFTIVDTPGFGDYTNNNWAWVPLINFVDAQHLSFMLQEEQPDRSQICDTRVHACLYFLQPTGHDLLPLDIKTMKELSVRVNLIPVIAKADSMTLEDREQFKEIVRSAMRQNNIRIFSPPSSGEQVSWPYSVIGSDQLITLDSGNQVRGRLYRWGVAEVDNPEHCDVGLLRDLLFREHMLELIDTTNDKLYFLQRRSLMAERLRTSLVQQGRNVPEWVERLTAAEEVDSDGGDLAEAMNAARGKIPLAHRPSVTFLTAGQLVDAEVAAAVAKENIDNMSATDIMTLIAPFGKEYLEISRREQDQLYKERVQEIREGFTQVARFEEERFKKWSNDLKSARDSLEADITSLQDVNGELQLQIDFLERQTHHHRRRLFA